jgi:SPP1 gp7 family putative phage head morphogenesis protein
VVQEDEAYTEEVRKLRRWAKGKLAPDVTLFKSAIMTDAEKRIALGDSAAAMPPFPTTRKALLLLDPDDDEAEQKVRRKLEKRSSSEIAKALNDILADLERRGAQFEHVPHQMAKEFNSLMKEMKQTRKLRDPIERMLVDGVDLGVKVASDQLANVGFSMDWSLVNTAAREWARQHAGEVVDQMDDATKNVLRESIARWMDSGEPLQALIDDIAPAFGEERAKKLATTEVTRSFGEANRQTYKESGVIEVVEWRTVNDELALGCPICGPLHEERRALDESFGEDVFGEEMFAPPAHPHCRCNIVAISEWGR